MHKTVSITINGEVYQETVPIRMLLVDFIRDVAGLTGTHIACTYEGVCGAWIRAVEAASVSRHCP